MIEMYNIYPCLWVRAKMTAYPILTYIDVHTKFQILDPKIQMKRGKRDIHAYILTDYPSYRISYRLIKKLSFPYIHAYIHRRTFLRNENTIHT